MADRARIALFLGALLFAGPPLVTAHGAAPTITTSSAFGVDSNVFLSDSNTTQTPRTSRFIHTTAQASLASDGSLAHRLGWTLRGSYRHYLRFGEADKLFADSIVAYRYAPIPALLVGLLQTMTYARLQLLDTEGSTLPRQLFASYAGEARAYTQVLIGAIRATFAGGLRRQDVNETDDLETAYGTIVFGSLDGSGYFGGLDLAYQPPRRVLSVNYEYAVTHYDELRASFQNGTTSQANPRLSLIQHTVRSQIGGSPVSWGRLVFDGHLRWTLDPFEDELTSRQADAKARTEVKLPFGMRWINGIGHRARVYVERRVATGERREERFLFADTLLEKTWPPSISGSAQYQYIRKASNVPNDEFRVRIYSVGLSYSF